VKLLLYGDFVPISAVSRRGMAVGFPPGSDRRLRRCPNSAGRPAMFIRGL